MSDVRVGGQPVAVARAENGADVIEIARLATFNRKLFFGKKDHIFGERDLLAQSERKRLGLLDEIKSLRAETAEKIAELTKEFNEKIKAIASNSCEPLLTRHDIRRDVCRTLCISIEEISSNRRDVYAVLARHIGMTIMRNLTMASWAQIGQMFGGKDHTTVIYARNKMQIYYDMAVRRETTVARIAQLMRDLYVSDYPAGFKVRKKGRPVSVGTGRPGA